MAEGDIETAELSSEGSKFMVHEGPKRGVKYPMKVTYVDGKVSIL